MPIYEYRCANGHLFEVMQRMSDDPLDSCGTCGASVQRVFHPVAVHFKGSGFYNTDYGKRTKGGGDSAGPDSSKPSEKSDAKGSDSGSGSSGSGSSGSGSSGSGSADSKPAAASSD